MCLYSNRNLMLFFYPSASRKTITPILGVLLTHYAFLSRPVTFLNDTSAKNGLKF